MVAIRMQWTQAKTNASILCYMYRTLVRLKEYLFCSHLAKLVQTLAALRKSARLLFERSQFFFVLSSQGFQDASSILLWFIHLAARDKNELQSNDFSINYEYPCLANYHPWRQLYIHWRWGKIILWTVDPHCRYPGITIISETCFKSSVVSLLLFFSLIDGFVISTGKDHLCASLTLRVVV